MTAANPVCVLVVEDEPAQRDVLSYNLAQQGYRVELAADGDEALLKAAEVAPDLILLDWMLPGLSGIEICRRLRKRAETRAVPIIMLTARSEDADRVRGLDTGADDYVVKPYSIRELLARVRSQLRRTRPASTGQTLDHGDIRLDPAQRKVTRGGQDIHLGPTEFRLLEVLMERPGRVFTRDQLLDRAWGREVFHDSRTVDVHIGRLRRALGRHGGPDPIRTVRGEGYALR